MIIQVLIIEFSDGSSTDVNDPELESIMEEKVKNGGRWTADFVMDWDDD